MATSILALLKASGTQTDRLCGCCRQLKLWELGFLACPRCDTDLAPGAAARIDDRAGK